MLRFRTIRLLYDKFLILENYIKDTDSIPHYLKPISFPETYYEKSFIRFKEKQPKYKYFINSHNRFIPELGRINWVSEIEDLLNERDTVYQTLNEYSAPPYFTFAATVSLRNWKISVAHSPNNIEGVQFKFNPSIYILQSGVFRICIELQLHIPGDANLNEMINIIRQLNPNPKNNNRTTTPSFNLRHNRYSEQTTLYGLFKHIEELIVSHCVIEKGVPSIFSGQFRTGIWLEKTLPWPSLPDAAKELRGLLYQDANWSKVRSSRIEEYKESDWGNYKRDSVLLRKNRALWCFIRPRPPFGRKKLRRHWLFHTMQEPWITTGAQDILYSYFSRELSAIYKTVFNARRNVRKKIASAFKYRFFRPEIFSILEEVFSIHKKMPAPRRRCYHQLAKHYALKDREIALKKQMEQVIRETDQWTIPVLSPIGKIIEAIKSTVI